MSLCAYTRPLNTTHNAEVFPACKALAAIEQLRPAANQLSSRALPHAEPQQQTQSLLLEKLPPELQLLVWEHVLQAPYTRIERWRPPPYHDRMKYRQTVVDAECFPYRLITSNIDARGKTEKPLALLLSCRQM